MKRDGEIKRGRLFSTGSYFRVRVGPGQKSTAGQENLEENQNSFSFTFHSVSQKLLKRLKATSSLFASVAPFICRLRGRPWGWRLDTELKSLQGHTVMDGFHSRTAHLAHDHIPHSIRYAEASKNYNYWTNLLFGR